jgi:hypothetical protein
VTLRLSIWLPAQGESQLHFGSHALEEAGFMTHPSPVFQNPPATSTPPESSGGVNAVAGFLFQMIGSAAFAVEVLDRKPIAAGGDCEIYFSLEPYDQDAGCKKVDSNGKIQMHLVQFKYSGKPRETGLATGDLVEIAEAFRVSKVRVQSDHQDLAMKYGLWTNRPLTTDGAKTYADAKNDVSNPKLDDEVSPTPKPGKANKAKVKNQRTKAKNKEYREILKILEIREINEKNALESLQKYARRYGVTDTEFPQAVNDIVIYFFKLAGTGASTVVSRQVFNEKLVGFKQPQALSLSELTLSMRDDIATFRANAKLPFEIYPRAIVRSIEEAAEDNALIVICGEGGCGKSAAVYSALDKVVGQPPHSARSYVAADFAVQVPSHWFSQSIARWRGAPPGCCGLDQPELALDRLELAAETRPRPLALLCIDGWDELNLTSPTSSELLSLMQFVAHEWRKSAGESPRIVLIATCRTPDDVLRIWPHHTGELGEDRGIKKIYAGDFDDTELEDLARENLTPEIAERLAYRSGTGAFPQTAGIIGRGASQTRPVRPEIREAIRHPLFWRFFVEKAPALQHRILDGDEMALWDVCRTYVGWFCEKAKHKAFGTDQPALKAMLKRIAWQPLPADGLLLQEEHWTKPACGAGLFRYLTADELFREARSFGMIRIDSPVRAPAIWRWRYSFIREFLETQSF